jgi:hypothetical protein
MDLKPSLENDIYYDWVISYYLVKLQWKEFVTQNILIYVVNMCLSCFFGNLCCIYCYIQESSKTNHPQLLYEAKLYNALQGGSMCLSYKQI